MSAQPIIEELDDLDRFLIGKVLTGGWIIKEPRYVQRDHPSTSRTYRAEDARGRSAFVKLLDNRATTDLNQTKLALDQFVYEREIVQKCEQRKMRRVVKGLGYGSIEIPGIVAFYLHYLIFEWAESDVRSRSELEGPLHLAHALRWLHHATTAIEELHYSEISHQDLKPANLLVRPNLDLQLCDFGRAIDGSLAPT